MTLLYILNLNKEIKEIKESIKNNTIYSIFNNYKIGPGVNLEGANLENLGEDFKQFMNSESLILGTPVLPDFNIYNLNGANLKKANLEGAYFYKSNLEGANFKESNLERAVFEYCNLEGANLEGASLYSIFDNIGINNINNIKTKNSFIIFDIEDIEDIENILEQTKTEFIKEILGESVKYTFPKGCNKLLEYMQQNKLEI